MAVVLDISVRVPLSLAGIVSITFLLVNGLVSGLVSDDVSYTQWRPSVYSCFGPFPKQPMLFPLVQG